MISVEHKRRRAKPHFSSELPVRITRAGSSHIPFDNLIKSLNPDSGIDLAAASACLEIIANDLISSRQMEMQKPSRRDSNAALLAIADRMNELLNCIDGLTAMQANALSSRIVFEGVQKPDWGTDEIVAMTEMLRSLEDAVFGILSPHIEQGVTSSKLTKVHDHARDAATELEGLSLDTEWALIEVLQYTELFPKSIEPNLPLSVIKMLVKRLEQLARVAHKTSCRNRGPRQDTAQFLAVKKLKVFYEQFTDSSATHSAVSNKQYCGVARSDFGKFVMTFMEYADPVLVNRRGLSEAISYAVWPMRSASKAPKIEDARLRREERIRQELVEIGML